MSSVPLLLTTLAREKDLEAKLAASSKAAKYAQTRLASVEACLLGTQLGTPRGRHDGHSSKFPSIVKPRFIEPAGERTTLPKVDAR
jgi:hypothetical protein